MKFYAPIFLLVAALLANGELCAQQYDGDPVAISESPLFETTGNSNWPYAITLTETSQGAPSQEEQTLDINVTVLPPGAEYRIFKTTENDPYVSPAQTLSAGSNTITVDAVSFDRTVRIQFSSGAITFDSLIVNAKYAPITISVDDFAGLNTEANTNNLAISLAENGLGLILGPGSSIQGRDAYGTGTSKFGQTGEWFDGSFAKFGNSGNQQLLDLRITNNTGTDAKLKNIAFDLRRPPNNVNYATNFQLLYLATGDSELIKGSSVADGTEIVNLVGIGSEAIVAGINNFSEFIGQNISGTAWIADGGYANIRLKLSTTAPQAATQLDNLVITCEILDMDLPTFSSPTTAQSISENSGAAQAVYTAVATDASGVTYTLKPVDDSAAFSIDGSTGVVTLTDDPDYESQSSYSFTVVATDGAGNFSEQSVTLPITDVDENAPVITSSATVSPIEENSGVGQAIYTVTATDASVVTYTLKSVDDFASFSIDSSTGVVTLADDPDYDIQTSYSFTVVAADSFGNFSEQSLTLSITDLDENPPVFTSFATAPAIAENSGAGQVIYTATATDASEVTYTLKSVDDFASFSIDGSTGVITLTVNPNETKLSYAFTVVATDSLDNFSEQSVTLAISDDLTAPVLFPSGSPFSISENSGAGQVIYTATATDASEVTYTLKSVDDFASFSIDGSTGVVTLTGDPDHESQSSYSFTVIATDVAGNSSEQSLTLSITDLDDTAPVFTSSVTVSPVEENSGAVQTIYTATATDASAVTYTLKSVDDFASFAIDPSTGVVTLIGDPDYESQTSYSFTVVATDSFDNSSEQSLTLSTTDLDENAPIFTSLATAPSIEENSGAVQTIYTATATDASAVTYTLKSVDDFASFTIDSSTGVVTLTGDPDHESQSSYSFTVVATDGAGNSSEQSLTLAINDLDRYVEAGAVDIGNGWRWTDWLGYFNVASDPWIYHLDHKWIYIPPSITNFGSIYYWDNTMNSFIWTSDEMYPELYRFSDGKWIWYLQGSKNPRWFVDLVTSEWVRSE